MPAALPGSTLAQNVANPSAGAFVIFCPLSGPKGSPLDNDSSDNASTGGLSTGIGMQSLPIIAPISGETNPQSIDRAGFIDDQTPGTISPNTGTQNTVNSTMMYIGGGRSVVTNGKNPAGEAGVNPYTAGVAICGAGNGASRDGGVGPTTFTGFSMKMVTAAGAVANGAVVETGWVNRSGVALVANQSTHGSSATQLAAPT